MPVLEFVDGFRIRELISVACKKGTDSQKQVRVVVPPVCDEPHDDNLVEVVPTLDDMVERTVN